MAKKPVKIPAEQKSINGRLETIEHAIQLILYILANAKIERVPKKKPVKKAAKKTKKI